MTIDFERWLDLLLHVAIGILGGGLAFRACMRGIGWGTFPGVAIPAGLATGMMAFMFSLILADMLPERHRVKIQLGIIAMLFGLHVVSF